MFVIWYEYSAFCFLFGLPVSAFWLCLKGCQGIKFTVGLLREEGGWMAMLCQIAPKVPPVIIVSFSIFQWSRKSRKRINHCVHFLIFFNKKIPVLNKLVHLTFEKKRLTTCFMLPLAFVPERHNLFLIVCIFLTLQQADYLFDQVQTRQKDCLDKLWDKNKLLFFHVCKGGKTDIIIYMKVSKMLATNWPPGSSSLLVTG